MTTYTPAPWTLDGGQIRDSKGDALASVPNTLGDAQDTANGRLMTAAPDLCEIVAQAVRYGCPRPGRNKRDWC